MSITPSSGPVVLAPDKFKGSLDAAEVAAALAAGFAEVDPTREVRRCPVADGGEGTVAAALANGWRPVAVPARGPGGKPLAAIYAAQGPRAVAELALTSGLGLVSGRPDPLHVGTEGLGDVIGHALEAGATEIILGLGGSATTDGGAGVLRSLGARILDEQGHDLPPGGGALARAARLDLEGLNPAARHATFLLASDVDNPLLGPSGAAAMHGPQKGASPAQVDQLDAALAQWARVLGDATGKSLDSLDRAPRSGAAGGCGCGLAAVLGAQQRDGVATVLELIGFEAALAGAVLVVTGEGRLDRQTLHGKAPVGVAAAAAGAGIPVAAVAGQCDLTPVELQAAGFDSTYALADMVERGGDAFLRAVSLLQGIGESLARQVGESRGRRPVHR